MYINVGVGIPTLINNFIPKDLDVTFHSENGSIGLGGYPDSIKGVDQEIINATRETVTLKPGASVLDSSNSFAMVRGGHVDLTFLGGMQVNEHGDFAN